MKRLVVLAIGVVLLFNFVVFLLSFPPYKRLGPLEPSQINNGAVVQTTARQEIMKQNIRNYIAINIGTMVVGITFYVLLKKKAD